MAKRTTFLAAVVTVALAGCGTTTSLAQQGRAGSGGAPATAPGAGLAQGSPASGGSSSGGATPAGSSSGGGSPAASGSSGAGGSSASASPGAAPTGGVGAPAPAAATAPASAPEAGDGPGVTATTINVGSYFDPNVGAADSAIGFSGISPGNTQAETNAMVAYINAHGGVAHRKIHMIWQQVNTETDSSTQMQQQTCATWTQDNKTFVMNTGLPIWDQCAAKEGAVGLYQTFLGETTPILKQYPNDIDQDGFTIDRGDKVTIEGLARQGYFAPGAKVGIATWAENDYQYGITAGVDPALAGVGQRNVPVEYITVPQTYSDLGATSASVASAILKFRSQGIDHVILLDGPAGINSSGVLDIEWMQQANSQSYYPKYGLNSTSGFTAAAGDYPTQEMMGSVGVGWFPSEDLSTADYDALPQTANQKACMQIMAAAGQQPQNGNQQSVEYGICDQFFFMQQAWAHITGPLNQHDALAAIDSVGSTFGDLTTFGTYFSASEHDGAQRVRNVAFVASCTCYRYTSPAYIPG